jgi:hypothetical protein
MKGLSAGREQQASAGRRQTGPEWANPWVEPLPGRKKIATPEETQGRPLAKIPRNVRFTKAAEGRWVHTHRGHA